MFLKFINMEIFIYVLCIGRNKADNAVKKDINNICRHSSK